MNDEIKIPLGVPEEKKDIYLKNYNKITRDNKGFFLFAGDQKIEHLNRDYVGEGISPEDAMPQHLFDIAGNANIGAFAAQYGLIARYGMDYTQVPYIVKMNSKTNLVSTSQMDPISRQLVTFQSVLDLEKNSNVQVAGVGYTIYLGSEYEAIMFAEAGRLVADAHKAGMVAILWIYPRGKSVKDEKTREMIVGAGGVAAALGADFVKVNLPTEDPEPFSALQSVVAAAGRTKVLVAGGSSKSSEEFLSDVYNIRHSGAIGSAVGRNMHQNSLEDAKHLANAISAIVYDGQDLNKALEILHEK